MVSWTRPLREELREVLVDVARDPRSTLLRVTEDKARRARWRIDAAHARSTEVTVAERELLTVHREDVAAVLRDAMRWRLRSMPRAADLLWFPTFSHMAACPPAREQVVRRSKACFQVPQARKLESTAEALLMDLSEETPDEVRPSLDQLRVVASRLHPTTSTELLWCQGRIVEGKHEEALPPLRSIVATSHSVVMRSLALSAIALAGELGKDPRSASRAYAAASSLWFGNGSSNVCWLLNAMAADDEFETRRALKALRERKDVDLAQVRESCRKFKRRYEQVHGRPVDVQDDWLPRVAEFDLDSEVIDALLA